ncbi:hypothetical protein [Corynebacterium uterequi]|uniref:Uncharacterized protein n=1 Tax=Corynebacterium uterequi TaxID=1072256 RepID=A0A0G3HDN5_9CORY|nr:hypothetical protein [Corynebacterium uterequi]AKK11481.1 hypothetical protein CUTER_07460 [Corynebacterium uterequi]
MLVSVLLATTFGCGVFIAAAHVINRRFLAPVYDVVANLLAFACATGSSALMGEWVAAGFAAVAVACWLFLGLRTYRAIHRSVPLTGQTNNA